MADNKPYRYLNAILVKNEYAENDFSAFLSSDSMVTKFAVERHIRTSALGRKLPVIDDCSWPRAVIRM